MAGLASSVLVLLAFTCGVTAVQAGPREIPLTQSDPYVHELGQRCDVQSGCLAATSVMDLQGEDSLGSYFQARTFYTTAQGTSVVLSERVYGNGMQVFTQHYPDGLQGTSTGDKNGVSAAYPRLALPDPAAAPNLRYVTPGGYMAGWTLYSQGSMSTELNWFRDGEDGGFIMLFQDEGDGSVSSVIMTSLTEPMGVNVRLDRDNLTLDWGVKGQVQSIPAGYRCEVLLLPGQSGLNKNIMAWGEAVRTYHTTVKRDDPSARVLSYYTDNGSAHYYNPAPFTDFYDALVNVYNISVENNIPIRRLQLDSWWYHKGAGNGVKNWTEVEWRLPGGIEAVYEATGWPVVAHNRYFSSDTDYASQNGGPYSFTIDEANEMSLPLDKVFWDDLMDDSLPWGMVTYEQDWLDRQYMFTSALHTNLTLGTSWLNNMATSADERSLNVQYCMSFIRHMLHSATLPAVTQIRVSDDYLLNPDQWRIGVSSLLVHALALRPYKDVFWTSPINENVVFYGCELVLPNPDHPLTDLMHQYGGRMNVSTSGKPCVPWRDFGWDDLYFGSGMYRNLCRNPEQLREGPFCYTKASFDIPEEEWEWEYCDVPRCDIDCYTFIGYLYIGQQNVTQSGQACVDWNGEYDLNGTMCRNPNNDTSGPWCYVTEDHSEFDYCGNKCPEATEENTYLQSAVSTFSAGPLGVGDRPENFNKELIMKSCNADGLLLHPSKPLTVVDGYFFSSDYRELWTGYSSVGGIDFGIVFMAEIGTALQMTPSELSLEMAFGSNSTRVFSNYPSDLGFLQTVSPGEAINLPTCGGYLNFCVLYTSPAMQTDNGDLYILGELDKWVPVSPQRISDITAGGSSVVLSVEGVEGEGVVISFSDGTLGFDVTCNFLTTGTMTLDAAAGTCV